MNGGTYLTGLITGIGKAFKNNQATAVLIKNYFAFAGFSKHHKAKQELGLYLRAGVWRWGWGVGAFYRMYFFSGRWAYNFWAYKWQFMIIIIYVVNLFIS